MEAKQQIFGSLQAASGESMQRQLQSRLVSMKDSMPPESAPAAGQTC